MVRFLVTCWLLVTLLIPAEHLALGGVAPFPSRCLPPVSVLKFDL